MSVPVDSSSPRKKGRTSSPVRSSPSPHSDGRTAVERLTDDLLVEILSRVPVKSLCRFKCVSNHCLALIDHPEHRKKLPQTPAGFFYGSAITSDWLLKSPVHFTDFPGRRSPPFDTSCTFLPDHRRVELLDCCNGLLLCRWYDVSAQGDEFHYIVCNPATEKWVVLPDSGKAASEVATTRLGFDSAVSMHFYVFELVNEQEFFWDPDIVGVAVYSSETGGWVYKEKKWNSQIRLIDHRFASVFLNGYLHFEADCRGSSPCLAVVDTEGETWMNFGFPDGLFDGFIQRSQGRLHYANFQGDEDGSTTLVVYVLENYQSKEWILKHSVEIPYIFEAPLLEWVDFRLDRDFDWIAIHPECNMIFFTTCWHATFTCYNMDSGQVKLISGLEVHKPPYMPYVPLLTLYLIDSDLVNGLLVC
uniref:Uncharacterized protein n=1 Tax=Aegilops tauschii TaxID=37682 RepID=M8CAL0_AEGTA